jgi:predicted secreted acid phosphatase
MKEDDKVRELRKLKRELAKARKDARRETEARLKSEDKKRAILFDLGSAILDNLTEAIKAPR